MKSEISQELAELYGMHAGDGTLYKTSGGHVWELRGGHDEKEFYDEYVVLLLHRIYAYPFVGRARSGGKNGGYGVRCCQKQFIKLLTDAGFPVGKKTMTVSVPSSVMQGSPRIKAAFLRGLFATDDCVNLSRKNGGACLYPRIQFATVSQELFAQVSVLLDELNIRHYSWLYD